MRQYEVIADSYGEFKKGDRFTSNYTRDIKSAVKSGKIKEIGLYAEQEVPAVDNKLDEKLAEANEALTEEQNAHAATKQALESEQSQHANTKALLETAQQANEALTAELNEALKNKKK